MGASGCGIQCSPFIGIACIVFVFTGLVFLVIFLSKKKKEHIEEVISRFQDQDVIIQNSSANFFGQESRGLGQIRGNGVLLLTNDTLFFSLLCPRKEISISVANIKGLKTGSKFLGKSKFSPLLIVEFINENGKTDSIAWLVKDLELFSKEIQDRIK